MANTYVAIATVTVGSGGAANIEFTSIPATYTDLVVKLSSRTDRAAGNAEFFVKFNGSSADFTSKKLYGDASSATVGSNSGVGGVSNAANNTASAFGSAEIYIPNYASANNKSFSMDSVQETNGAGNSYLYLNAMLWSITSAITSITLYPEDSKNWVQYSTATLYGIKSS